MGLAKFNLAYSSILIHKSIYPARHRMKMHLTATEAADFLNISKPTLYAYVSRGLVQSEYGLNQRSRVYHRLDLERLKQRKRIRQQPSAEMSNALYWGSPLLESSLTLLTNGQVFYRGQEATALASSQTFLEVATWFWTGNWEVRASGHSTAAAKERNRDPILLFHEALLRAAMTEPLGYDFSLPNLCESGTHILSLFLQILTRKQNPNVTEVARELRKAWCRLRTDAETIINAALILCIDHELNVSSFTARVVCSAGTSIYEVVSAALCALRGSRHGGGIERATKLLVEMQGLSSVRSSLLQRIRAGIEIPGFGHPLYPNGDPRAAKLLDLLNQYFAPEARPWLKVADSAAKALKRKPNIDLALAVCSLSLQLPSHAAFALFALGRTAGWIAHAAEQAQGGKLIRPRARYTGPVPTSDGVSLEETPAGQR
jgi:citrate synthase